MPDRRLYGVTEGELQILESRSAAADRQWAYVESDRLANLDATPADKRFATPKEVLAYFIEDDQPCIQVGDRTFRLQREDEADNLSPEEIDQAAQNRLHWDEVNQRPDCASTPSNVDHRRKQTPIRYQEDRGTCVCFAALACLEAIEKTSQGTDLDLSEQYANWLFMKFQRRDQCEDGLKTTDAALYLSQKGVCEEQIWPYENLAAVHRHCTADPPPQIQRQARYGIDKYVIIDRPGPNGPSIANTAYLECILDHGHDIVFGIQVAWGNPDPTDKVLDVILDAYGNPLRSRGGHAMLLVGYDKTAPRPYFIFKNSWGAALGDQGYYYLSYDYVRTYSKYGYVVLRESSDKA